MTCSAGEQVRAEADTGRVDVTACDVRHRAGHRQAVELGRDRDRVGRDAVDEVHRAVDGVHHPPHRTASLRRPATLLAEDRLARPQFGQPIPDQLLGFGVSNGDRVGGAALRAQRGLDRSGSDTEDLRPPASHEGRRLSGYILGDGSQFSGPDIHHRAIAT